LTNINAHNVWNIMEVSKDQYRKVLEMASGLSLAICIPKPYMSNLSLVAGDFVKVRQEQQRIIIEKA